MAWRSKISLYARKLIVALIVAVSFVLLSAGRANAFDIIGDDLDDDWVGGDCDKKKEGCYRITSGALYIDSSTGVGNFNFFVYISDIYPNGWSYTRKFAGPVTTSHSCITNAMITNVGQVTISPNTWNSMGYYEGWAYSGNVTFNAKNCTNPNVQYEICANIVAVGSDPTGGEPYKACAKFYMKYWKVEPYIQIYNPGTMSAWSSTGDIDASPGDTIHWHHSAREVGGIVTSLVTWGYNYSTGSNTGQNLNMGSFWLGRNGYFPDPSIYAPGATQTTFRIPDNATVGSRYCRRTYLKPSDETSTSSYAYSGELCAKVVSRWNVTPETKISVNGSGFSNSSGSYTSYAETKIARPNQYATWSHRLIQNGPTATSATVSFQSSYGGSGWAPGGTRNWQSIFSGTGVGTTYYTNNGYAPGAFETTGLNWNSLSSTQKFTEWRRLMQDDVKDLPTERQYCSTLVADRYNQNGGSVNSGQHCVWVPYNYELTGRTETDGGSTATPGDAVNFNYTIHNTGQTKSRYLGYRAFTFVIPKDNYSTSIQSGLDSTTKTYSSFVSASCANRAGVGVTNCIEIPTNPARQGSGVNLRLGYYSEPPPKTENTDSGHRNCYQPATYSPDVACKVGERSVDIDSYGAGPGDRICSYVVIENWKSVDSSNPGTYLASNVKCVEIIRQPQLQIRGADSYSGARRFGDGAGAEFINNAGGFESFNSSQARRGSWSQYGLLAGGDIKHFGSAGYTMTNRANACKLQFSNTWTTSGSGMGSGGSNCSTIFGNSNAVGGGFWKNSSGNSSITRDIKLPNEALKTAIPTGFNTPNYVYSPTEPNTIINLNTLNTNADGFYYHNGNAKLQGTHVANGKRIYLIVTGNLTITGSIYNSSTSFTNLNQIPIITIVADNIYVDKSVGVLTGTYIAKKSFYSCTNGSGLYGISGTAFGESGECKDRLSVNGAIITKNKPRFQRVMGGGATNGIDSTCLNAFAIPNTTANCGKYDITPSEIINYTPNLFLTPYVLRTDGSSGAINWTTVSEKSLPVRL